METKTKTMTTIYLTQIESDTIAQSKYSVEGSYEEGYLYTDEFEYVCDMLGIDICSPDFTEDEIAELEKTEVCDIPYEAIYTW